MDPSAMNKAQKMVKILDLMTRKDGVNASELMRRFDLDARTLRRYLSDLRELRLPIIDEGRGDERIVGLDPSWRRTGIQLSLAEVLYLHFGRKLFDFLQGTSFGDGAEGALDRLQPAIRRTDANLAEQLDTRFLAVPEPTKSYQGTAGEMLEDLLTAVVYNRPVEARYRKANGVERKYTLHAYTLAIFRQGLYLFALDVAANQVKTFAVERFVDLVPVHRETFQMPHGWRPEAHIAHAFGIISGPPERVAIAFDERVAAYIKERTWHPTQVYRTLPDGRLELRMDVATSVELTTWILSFGPDAQVIEPPELRERIHSTIRAALARYEEGAP